MSGAPSRARSRRARSSAAHEYVSKETALGRFKQTFSDLAGSIETLGENPLPASYEVRLRTGPAAEAGVEALGAKLRETPGVADVRYDRQWLSRLMSAIAVIRGVGLVMGAVLTIAAALTVASVVRLALHARRDEIEIMQLVGAPSGLHSRSVRHGGGDSGRRRRAGRGGRAGGDVFLAARPLPRPVGGGRERVIDPFSSG